MKRKVIKSHALDQLVKNTFQFNLIQGVEDDHATEDEQLDNAKNFLQKSLKEAI